MTKGFKKGHDPKRNTKGRPKGSPNRTTEELRSMLQMFIDSNIDTLQSCFDSLEAKEKLVFFDKLLKHVLPAPLHPLEKLSEEQLNDIITKLKNNEL